jgi:hypothetical protein
MAAFQLGRPIVPAGRLPLSGSLDYPVIRFRS